MLFQTKKPRLTQQESLAAKPTRLVSAGMQIDENGGGRLKVPLPHARWAWWIFKAPSGATKTFEFDAIGIFVWEACDGKNNVQQIIRKLSKRYNLTLREAQVSTVKFLHTLSRKGLVGMEIKKQAGSS